MTADHDEAINWRRSGFCSIGACVEVAFTAEAVLLRNSSTPRGPVLLVTRDEWWALVQGIKDGQFDID